MRFRTASPPVILSEAKNPYPRPPVPGIRDECHLPEANHAGCVRRGRTAGCRPYMVGTLGASRTPPPTGCGAFDGTAQSNRCAPHPALRATFPLGEGFDGGAFPLPSPEGEGAPVRTLGRRRGAAGSLCFPWRTLCAATGGAVRGAGGQWPPLQGAVGPGTRPLRVFPRQSFFASLRMTGGESSVRTQAGKQCFSLQNQQKNT